MPFVVSEAARGTARVECAALRRPPPSIQTPSRAGLMLHTEDYYPLSPSMQT